MSVSGAYRSMRRAAVAVLLGLIAVGAIWWGRGAVHAQAPAPPAQFAYLPLYQGWNLISAADMGDISFAGGSDGIISGPLYGLAPGAKNYSSTPLDQVNTGAGYWAYVSQDRGAVVLSLSETDSTTVDLPANSCALVGNPSTKGSARVLGADTVYTYSNPLNQYVQQTLVGVGQGALACNGDHASVVSIAYVGDNIPVSWPNCCDPTPSSDGGNARLIFRNDSPAPITVTFRAMDNQGNPDTTRTPIFGEIPACTSCPEYVPADHAAQGCATAATTITLNEPPGPYHLVIHSDDANVPDLISDVTVAGDTQYTLCYFIDATRPQKALPPGS